MQAPDISQAAPAASAPRRRGLWGALRWPLAFILLALMAHQAHGRWSELTRHALSFSWSWGAFSLVGLLGCSALGCELWRRWIGALGAPLGFRQAFGILFQANMAKYLPGGAWHFVGRVVLCQRAGIPPLKTTLSLLMETAGHLAAGALIGLAALPLLPGAHPPEWLLAAAAALVLAGMHPRSLNLGFGLIGRLTRRSVPEVPFSYGFVLAMLGLYVLYWALLGGCFATFAQALSASPLTLAQAGLLTGALAIAWVVGAATLVAPAGLGVREAALVAIMGSAFPAGWPVVLALASRLWFITGEAIAFGVASSFSSRRAGQAPAGEATGS